VQFLTSPNAVLATVLASTCVAALSAYVVISQIVAPAAPEVTGLAVESPADEAAELAREAAPEARRVVWTPMTEAHGVETQLGFADPALSLARPNLGSVDTEALDDAYTRRLPVLVVIGRPPVVPPQRPETETTLVRIARDTTEAQLLALGRPSPRPEFDLVDPDRAANSAAPQVASLRPSQRPVTLSTRSVAPEAEAVEATIQQAALSGDSPRGQDSVTLAPARSGPNPCSNRMTREIPRRPGSAAPGSAVMASLGGVSGGTRDNAIVAEALRGNMPSHLRDLQPVRFSGIAAGRPTEIVICVTPDYLSIGSDRDNIRVPMGLPAALRIADAFDMMLPTPRMVDAIYQQADVRLSPQPMTPGAQMSSTNYFVRHDATLDGQMASAGARDGLLIAGHKKDVVIANRLGRAPGRVAIYGWHRTSGSAIQPLSTVHGEYYADYSHGIRLVSRTAYRDGRPVDLRALLTDSQYASLLNNDGPLSSAAVRLAALQ